MSDSKQKIFTDVVRYLQEKKGAFQGSMEFIRNTMATINYRSKYFEKAIKTRSYDMFIKLIAELILVRYRKISQDASEYGNKQIRDTLQDIIKGKSRTLDDNRKDMKVVYTDNSEQFDINLDMQIEKSVVKSITIDSLFGIDSFDKFIDAIYPDKFEKKAYLVLDSRYRDKTNSFTMYNSIFRWNYMPGANFRDGFVNTCDKIENIKSIKMLQPVIPGFYTPLISNTFKFRFEEFTNECFEDRVNKYHFSHGYMGDYSTVYHDVNTIDHNDTFTFNLPIRVVESFTVKLLHANSSTAYSDRLWCTATHGATTTFVSTADHNLSTGDIVIFDNFASGTTADNTVVTTINRNSGHSVTVVNSTTFRISVATTIGQEVSGLVVNAFIQKYRLILPLEITYIPNKLND